MIFSENPKPELSVFRNLMQNTDDYLNRMAIQEESYFIKRGGKALESDVYNALVDCAKGTPFEGTIHLVSGASFPDIVANKFYGVEVKSTEKNHWTSTGSSILESTRNQDVERIYLTFGKLGKPVQFLSRPYEECLSGIAVTHYPRYLIDMRLEKGQSIFDKMGIPYDELRRMENPVDPVSKYYKSKLQPGERLWWAADSEQVVPPTVKLWKSLDYKQKEECIVQGYVLFPELLNASNFQKYNRYALWLATQKGVVNTNVRDGFSAGGQVLLKTSAGIEIKMPAAFGRINKYKEYIEEMLYQISEYELMESWNVSSVAPNRVEQWCELVATEASSLGYDLVLDILSNIFHI